MVMNTIRIPMKAFVKREKLEALLSQHHFSQKEFAFRLRVSPQYLSNIMNRRDFVGPMMRRRLLSALRPLTKDTDFFDFKKDGKKR
jgi:transcriptional regulator with XRE-family HTH domain